MGDRPLGDAELATRAKEGDRAAFAELVELHSEIAFRVSYLITGSAAEAEDATQEAFVKAFSSLDRFRAGSAFRPWLLRIVANEAKNRRRSSGRRLVYETKAGRQVASGDAVPSPEVVLEEAETRRALLQAVNDLPDRERMIVGLRYFLELTTDETARVVGIPRGTVKSRLSRALGRLRVAMDEGDGHG
ncbi:MAG: RNA polymerase sigma factor [Acidimicrobiia bacterium]